MKQSAADRRDLKPLAGATILVTRADGQAQEFTEQIQAAGADVLVLPTIEICPPESFAALDEAIRNLERYDWIIFTSVNGIAPFLERLQKADRTPAALGSIQVGAIGPATASRLAASGIAAALVPDRYQAEGILDALTPGAMAGKRVLIPRAAQARDVLPETLRAWGAQADVVSAYRTAIPNVDVAPVRERLRAGQVDVITFTSSSTVSNFVRLLGGGTLAMIASGSRIACIGPITAETVTQAGGHADIVAHEFTTADLVRAIIADFARRGRGVARHNPGRSSA